MRLSRFGYVLAVTADSPIRTLADFKGKQIGEPGPGSPVEVVARSLLAGAGLAPSDYSFAPIGYAATNLQAVLSKRVDATADTYSNLITNEVESHVAYRIYRDPIIGDIGDAGYGARPATIATRGDVLKRFSRALAKAAVFVRADPQAAARLYMQAAGERITGGSLAAKTQVITLLEGDLPANDPANHRIGYVSGTGLALLSQALVTDGFALQPVPPSAIATNAFLTYTNDFNHNAVQTQAHTLH
jgi:NitT/TauT family transport system substrate-binding protein